MRVNKLRKILEIALRLQKAETTACADSFENLTNSLELILLLSVQNLEFNNPRTGSSAGN